MQTTIDGRPANPEMVLLPRKPTPQMLASAVLAISAEISSEQASAARDAACVVLLEPNDLVPGLSLEEIAMAISRVLPAYVAMAKFDATEHADMRDIGYRIATQDNRITDAPIFIVQQKRSYVTEDGYHDSRIVWVDDEGVELHGAEADHLDARYERTGDTEIHGCRRLAVNDVWEFVTACFTEQGCKDYLAADGHNLREPRIYAMGSYRNQEWRQVRSHLLSLRGEGEGQS